MYFEERLITNFHDNKIPKQGSQCICLSVILLYSVFITDKICYTKLFMEEYKYIAKDKKMAECITDHSEIYSDEESFEEKDSDK